MSPRLPTAWQGPAPLHSPSGKAAMGYFINLTELAGKNRDIFWHFGSQKVQPGAVCMVQTCLEVSSTPPKPMGYSYPWRGFFLKNNLLLPFNSWHMNSVGFCSKSAFHPKFLAKHSASNLCTQHRVWLLNGDAPFQGIFSFQLTKPTKTSPTLHVYFLSSSENLKIWVLFWGLGGFLTPVCIGKSNVSSGEQSSLYPTSKIIFLKSLIPWNSVHCLFFPPYIIKKIYISKNRWFFLET